MTQGKIEAREDSGSKGEIRICDGHLIWPVPCTTRDTFFHFLIIDGSTGDLSDQAQPITLSLIKKNSKVKKLKKWLVNMTKLISTKLLVFLFLIPSQIKSRER